MPLRLSREVLRIGGERSGVDYTSSRFLLAISLSVASTKSSSVVNSGSGWSSSAISASGASISSSRSGSYPFPA